ncbi:hypothetical protein [Mesorhizobium sp. M1A.F.Ca.ET.072.01.1.1]|uniref:dienelactone hydrolase family protein n=1 Tax=Mesorhizobium sp. M1A.F.Ca.ET.072.01.1.1 TaxID=2496753 RepID=UPI001FE17B23|nr:hypothetical protein [Mesorhizobium sp. M1A.F.Ca.ET.072.01.1.1]
MHWAGLASLWAVHANADEVVHFETAAAVKPTPFQVRIAQQSGQMLKSVPGTPLNGYLTRPPGKGPFPAVILLHGCAGVLQNDQEVWPERLSSWGYVVLVVDSFSTRGVHDPCNGLLVIRVYDVYGALDFLSKYSFVESSRIALMGFSSGGITSSRRCNLAAPSG